MSDADVDAFFEDFSQDDRPQTVEDLARELVKRNKRTGPLHFLILHPLLKIGERLNTILLRIQQAG